jgi:putative ABC transport system permease protein
MSAASLHVRLAFAGLARNPLRTLLRGAVLAAAVALLAAMLLFISDSLRTASASAVRAVPLDWQGPVTSYSKDVTVAQRVAHQAGVSNAAATATAPFAGASHTGPAGHTATGSGSIFAVPPSYQHHFNTFRMLQGSIQPGKIVLDQQMAATLQARIGDTVRISPAKGAPARSYVVSGVGLITVPDQVFQPLNPSIGPAPAQPPSNAAIMPIATFAKTYAPALPAVTAASALSNSQPGAQQGVQWEVQAQLAQAPLAAAGSPSAALKLADQTRNRVERSLPGQVQFVDNLSDSLNTAAGDALYGEALYVLLAVPGALIAFGVAYLAALGTSERDRRDFALLRARGARRQDLLTQAIAESALLGLVAGIVAAAVGMVAVKLLVSGTAISVTRAIVTTAVSILLAIAGSTVARLAAVSSALSSSVAEARRATRRDRRPAWQRYYLDLVALGGSGLVYWLTIRTGFSAVVNPDSNPTLSLAVYMFFGPALLWLGATLLIVRLRGGLLGWVAKRAAGRRPGSLRSLVLASAGRRGPAINRGLLVVGLLLAFGVSLAIFSATYEQQGRVDAQLTLGADVTATAPSSNGSATRLAHKVASVPGVNASTALDHSYAYVGPDLQDTYGIDPASFQNATTLRDSYFLGGSAGTMMSRLEHTPNGILVSLETITDYSLKPGDLLKLRVLNQKTGRFHVAPFRVVGTVQEFPSAPRDSFMVTNLRYLEKVTHAPGPNVVFAKTSGSPTAVAHHVAAATRTLGATVKNIDQQQAQTSTSLTTVDLTGISHIEEAFAVVLAAAAMALFVATTIAERRRELALMTAIGASVRQAGAFVWSEAAIVLAAALVLAAGLGWLAARMLVAMLTHVFDPPPDTLAVPWGFLAGLGGAAIVAVVAASLLAIRSLGRMPLGRELREQ